MLRSIERGEVLMKKMMMIAGVVFMTIANAKLKRSTTVPMSVAVFAIIGLVCILSRIPYHVWFA